MTAVSPDDAAARPRPKVHFTAEEGWINDPYGIAWVDDRYHLYYQAVPGQVVWGPNCHWGHAESPDLVHWSEQPLALVPQEFEVGCWSGSVVHGEEPTIFYTRVVGDDWGLGKVAAARPDPITGRWRTCEDDVLVDGPPAELPVRAFRDPFVFRYNDDWIMLVGVARTDGTAAALQYRSTDLKAWQYDGVLCARPEDRGDDVWTGALWECPQLFPLGDVWVLLVSVWSADTLYHVAAATGSYDGRTFTPRAWQQLTHGTSAYAMTAFADRDGRRCVLSWLREEPQNDPTLVRRAGAHSVAAVVTLDAAGSLVLSPHPDLSALRQGPLQPEPAQTEFRYTTGDEAVELTLTPTERLRCELLDGDRSRLTVTWDAAEERLLLLRPGRPPASLPLGRSADQVLLLIDADLVEVFSADGYGAYRIPPARDRSRLQLSPADLDHAVHPLRPTHTPKPSADRNVSAR